MTITNYELLNAVLHEVDSVTEMAVLHREGEIAYREVNSDVDLCVADSPNRVMSAIVPRLADSEIFLILVSYYDRCSYSFFFSDLQAQSGAQVDLLHDSKGVGRIGVRTNVLLDGKHNGVRWPRINHLDEGLYVLRKRQIMRDIPRFLEAHRALREQGTELATRRSAEIFSPRARSAVVKALTDNSVYLPRTTGIWLSRAMRPSRLVRRYGFWAHLVGDHSTSEAANLAQRMGLLINAEAVVDLDLSCVLANLWRPFLLVSTGKRPAWLRPDMVMESVDGSCRSDALAAQLVASMYRRTLRWLASGSEYA